MLLTGAEANEFFFRASDEELDQAEAYPFMTPIFGEGVVFDADPERAPPRCCTTSRCATSTCRATPRPSTAEVERMVADWGDEGEIDLLDWFAELSIYTSTACLIGKRFREELDVHVRRAITTTSSAAPTPIVLRRPVRRHRELPPPRRGPGRAGRARREIMDGRDANPPEASEDRDLLDVLMSIKDDDGNPQFSADDVTGMFISMMFAGHHTTLGHLVVDDHRAAAQPRRVMAEVSEELDDAG